MSQPWNQNYCETCDCNCEDGEEDECDFPCGCRCPPQCEDPKPRLWCDYCDPHCCGWTGMPGCRRCRFLHCSCGMCRRCRVYEYVLSLNCRSPPKGECNQNLTFSCPRMQTPLICPRRSFQDCFPNSRECRDAYRNAQDDCAPYIGGQCGDDYYCCREPFCFKATMASDKTKLDNTPEKEETPEKIAHHSTKDEENNEESGSGTTSSGTSSPEIEESPSYSDE